MLRQLFETRIHSVEDQKGDKVLRNRHILFPVFQFQEKKKNEKFDKMSKKGSFGEKLSKIGCELVRGVNGWGLNKDGVNGWQRVEIR